WLAQSLSRSNLKAQNCLPLSGGSRTIMNLIKVLFVIAIVLFSSSSYAASLIELPGVDINLNSIAAGHAQVNSAMQILLLLTVLSLAPSILIMVTAFTRIIIVLSMLRHAFGLQQTPPNSVLISLALFLTLFVMMPVIDKSYNDAVKPYMDNQMSAQVALDKGISPLRDFMIKQTHEKDIRLILTLSHSEMPKKAADIPIYKLVPAFMLSELQTAFQIGFMIFLPFLLVDLLVGVILMSLGMVMVPPTTISLPIKILMFVLISGWDLVINALVGSFH
ncbi:MAG: flagellar type III secretion system pore protein FliP, partial [Francisellaceae bacterium]